MTLLLKSKLGLILRRSVHSFEIDKSSSNLLFPAYAVPPAYHSHRPLSQERHDHHGHRGITETWTYQCPAQTASKVEF